MATLTKRFETRLDQATDDLITKAAELTHVSKSAFVTRAARIEAERVVARTETTFMDPEVFDSLINSLDVPDEAPRLTERLRRLPRIGQ